MERKFFTSLVLIILFPVCVNAWDMDVHNEYIFEYEGSLGTIVGNKANFDGFCPGPSVQFEFRYNILPTNIDIGLQLGGGLFYRERNQLKEKFIYLPEIKTYIDYNFCRGQKFSLFGGVGIGGSYTLWNYYSFENQRRQSIDSSHMQLSPRVGVMFLGHIRFTAEYNFTIDKYFNYYGAAIGVFFGTIKSGRE